MSRRARRRWLFRLAFPLLVLGLLLLVGEIAARRAAPEVPRWQAADSTGVVMVGHPTRLWGMGTGVRKNVDTIATISALGIRGDVPVTPRPEGVERILLVGDSSFFGHALPDDETLARQIERKMPGVEVVNAAIPGYSTEQTRLLLDEIGWDLEPTLVLSGNLWSDNNADGFRDKDLLRTRRWFSSGLFAESALLRVAFGWADRVKGGTGARVVTWTRDSRWPHEKERRVPVQDYAANLDAIAREAASRGAGMALIAPANKATVSALHPDGAGWDPYFRAQREVAAWHRLPRVDATAAFQASGQGTDTLFVDLMHPSVEGAGVLAEAVVAALRAAGWPDQRLLARAEPFDPSGLVDNAPVVPGGQPARYSPQAQLFPEVVDSLAGPAPPDPDYQEPGGARWAADPASWAINGVVGGTATAGVQVLVDGRVVGSVVLPAGGPFRIPVALDVERAVVRVDRSGEVLEQEAIRGGADVRFP